MEGKANLTSLVLVAKRMARFGKSFWQRALYHSRVRAKAFKVSRKIPLTSNTNPTCDIEKSY
jgi:hypothetical protein